MAIEQGLGLLALGYYFYLQNKKKQETFDFDANALLREQEATELARQKAAIAVVQQGTFKDDTDPRTFHKGTLQDGNLIIGSLTATNPSLRMSQLRGNNKRNDRIYNQESGCAGKYGFEFVANLMAPPNQEAIEMNYTGRWGFVVVNPFETGFQSEQPAWYKNLVLTSFSTIATLGTANATNLSMWQISTFNEKSGTLLGRKFLKSFADKSVKAVTGYQAYEAMQSPKPAIAGEMSIQRFMNTPMGKGGVLFKHTCNDYRNVSYRPVPIGTVCKTKNPYYDLCANNAEGEKWVSKGTTCQDGSNAEPLLENCIYGQTPTDETQLIDSGIRKRFYWDGRVGGKQFGDVSAGKYVASAWFEVVTGLGELGEITPNSEFIKIPTAWTPIVISY